jgi:hypothetical protein
MVNVENILWTIGILSLIGGSLYFSIKGFVKLGKEKQLKIVKEWLLLAVVEAEKKLGGGTGQLKLRFVYDLFIDRFKYLAYVITFEQFSLLVDEALEKMRKLIESNELIKIYTENK